MVAPVNPVGFMGDIIMSEGMQKTVKTDADRQRAFSEFLVEEIFIRDMFSQESSIFKPEPDDEDSLFSAGVNGIYSEYTKKQLAEFLASEGLFDEVLYQRSGVRVD